MMMVLYCQLQKKVCTGGTRVVSGFYILTWLFCPVQAVG